MASILFGFGGVRFDDGVSVATFSGGKGIISFKPIQIIKETVEHNISSRLIGYMVTLKISELYNLETDDWSEYQSLIRILGGMVNSTTQRTVKIYPRDDSTITNDISYECILTSDFSPEDVHRVKTGQVVDLEFTAISKVITIPNIFSDSTATIYWNGTDQYYDGTDTYYDGQG